MINNKGYIKAYPSTFSDLSVAPVNRYAVGTNITPAVDNSVILGKPGTSTTGSMFVGVGTCNPNQASLHIVGSPYANDYKDSKGSSVPGILSVQTSTLSDLFTISPTITTLKDNTVNFVFGTTTNLQIAQNTTTFSTPTNQFSVTGSSYGVTATSSGLTFTDSSVSGYTPSPFTRYMTGTFDGTPYGTNWPRGSSLAPPLIISYCLIGNIVILRIPAVPTGQMGTLDDTANSTSAIPSVLRPSSNTGFTYIFGFEGSYSLTSGYVDTGGVVHFPNLIGGGSPSFCISYPLV